MNRMLSVVKKHGDTCSMSFVFLKGRVFASICTEYLQKGIHETGSINCFGEKNGVAWV